MATRRILTLLMIGTVSLLAACGGGSSGSNSKGTQPPAVGIAFTPAPTSTTVAVGSKTGISITPAVTNDSTNAGVDWSFTCPLAQQFTSSLNPPCGTLSITTLHSDSGTAVTYLPPSILPGGTTTVSLTAFATADHTKNVTASITVTSYTSVLKGTYILQVTGFDGFTFAPYQNTGAFTFDGNGNITGGEQVLNTYSGFSNTYTLQDASTNPSVYFIGPDGRGTITLNLQQANNTVNQVTETFNLVVLSSSSVLLSENDTYSGAGRMEVQDATAAATMPSGAYAFVTSGSDYGNQNNPLGLVPTPTAMGGVFNIDNNPSPGSISGNGSLADQDYYNTNFTKPALQSCVPPTGVTGSVSQPDSHGAVIIDLTGATCFGTLQPGTIQFTGFIVDSTHIRLIESDDINGTSGFLTAGIAVAQGSAAGTFTTASLSGNYVLGILGYDPNSFTPDSFTAAAVVNADGAGSLGLNTNPPGISDLIWLSGVGDFPSTPVSGTYTVDANFIGRAALVPKFKGLSPAPKVSLLFYLTGNGTPPLVLWAEGEDVNYPAVGTGIAYPQAANASSLSFGNPENYGVSFAQPFSNNLGINGDYGTGQMTSAINGIAGTLTGTLDDVLDNNFQALGGGSPPLALTDTFVLPADSFGRIAGTFMAPPGGFGPFVEYYMIDDNSGVLIENDLGQTTIGNFAQSCDVTSATACQAAAKKSSRMSAQRSRNSSKNSAGTGSHAF